MDTGHHSKKGEKLTFETPVHNIHKLMHETCAITDEEGKKIGLDLLEIRPLGEGVMEVTAVIIWVEDNPPETEEE